MSNALRPHQLGGHSKYNENGSLKEKHIDSQCIKYLNCLNDNELRNHDAPFKPAA